MGMRMYLLVENGETFCIGGLHDVCRCNDILSTGYEVYGREFIETFLAFWPADVQLYVYYEGDKPADANDMVKWLPLDADQDRAMLWPSIRMKTQETIANARVRFRP